MPDRITIKVDGLRELGEAMKELGPKNAQAIARAMTQAGAVIVKKAAIDAAPEFHEEHIVEGVVVQPGNLKRNIVVKNVSKNKTKLTNEKIVTVRGKKKDGYAARYGRLVEYGTVNMGAQPFLRPALSKNIVTATNAMATAGRKRIDSITKRLVKKGR